MIFDKNKGERKMYVDMGKMQESEGRKSLSLSSKSKIKRKDKNKGKKIQNYFAGTGDKHAATVSDTKSQNCQLVLIEIVRNSTEIDLLN